MALTDRIVRGMIIKIDGDPHIIMEREFYKPGKGNAFNRTKLKNLKNGKIFTNTYKSGEKVEEIEVETKNMIYMYNDGTDAYFMDPNTYDQVGISLELIPGGTDYLVEEVRYVVVSYEGDYLSVRPPVKVAMEVVETTDAVRGNTSGNAYKEAITNTGARIEVPLFIKVGDKISVNTESNTYDSKEN